MVKREARDGVSLSLWSKGRAAQPVQERPNLWDLRNPPRATLWCPVSSQSLGDEGALLLAVWGRLVLAVGVCSTKAGAVHLGIAWQWVVVPRPHSGVCGVVCASPTGQEDGMGGGARGRGGAGEHSSTYQRLEKRLGGIFLRVQTGWSAIGGGQKRLAGLAVNP